MPPTGVQEGACGFANICPGNFDEERMKSCFNENDPLKDINSTLPTILIQPIG